MQPLNNSNKISSLNQNDFPVPNPITMENFPNEIWLKIFQYLSPDARDLMNASLVCKLWYKLVNDPTISDIAWKVFVKAKPKVKPFSDAHIYSNLIPKESRNNYTDAAVSPNKNQVATINDYSRKEIVLYSQDKKPLHIILEDKIWQDHYICPFLEMHDCFLTALFFRSLNSCILRTYSRENGELIWSNDINFTQESRSDLMAVDGKHFIFCKNNTPHVLNLESGECLPLKINDSILFKKVSSYNYGDYSKWEIAHINQIDFKNGKIAALFDNEFIQIWDITSGTNTIINANTPFINYTRTNDVRIALHNEINKIAIAVPSSSSRFRHFIIKIFDLDTGKEIYRFNHESVQYPDGEVKLLKFESDAKSTYKITVIDSKSPTYATYLESKDKVSKSSLGGKISKLFSSNRN